MRRLLLLLAVPLAISGCVRTSALTEVSADGTWKRTLKLVVAKDPSGEPPQFEKMFTLPTGAGWTKTTNAKEEETEMVFTRTAKLEETVKDLIVRDNDGPMMTNSVTVKQIAPNRYEYRETFSWVGKKKDALKDSPLQMQELKALLPAGLTTDQDLERVAEGLKPKLVRVMFGPGEPMLLNMLSNPDYGTRKLVSRLALSFDQVLKEVYGDRLSEADRRKAIASIVDKASTSFVSSKKSEANEASPSSGPPVTMYFSVKLPGKIVESDGEVDPYTGEVFWSMFPEAASLGDVTIHAICETGG